jgi:ABC-type transport system involved in Fe-S cluster assembly fused permease/ATPase subunit
MSSPATATADVLIPALYGLQSLLPLSTGLLYIATSVLNCMLSTRQASPSIVPVPQSVRNVTLALMLCVLVTYSTDAALLLHANFYGRQHISEDSIIFSLGSILVWTLLVAGFTNGAPSLGLPLWSSWVIYLVGESTLLFIHPQPSDKLHRITFALQIIRLVDLFLLCSLAASRVFYKNAPWRYDQEDSRNDDAHRPLLQGSCPGNNAGYSTVNNNLSGDVDSSDESNSKEPNSILSQSLEIFKFALPLLWPKGRFKLQLLFIGVGLCLLAERLLVVYVPIQLGIITNTLAQKNILPWRNIAFLVFLRLLESSGGISVLRAYMWLPLERHTYQRIVVTGFDQVMDLSCDFHDDKSSGSVWHAITRGTVIRNVVRTVLFQLGPMVSDLLIAVTVLHVMFGAYMGLVTAAVIGLFLWSSGRIVSLQRSKRKEYISAIGKEVNIRCEATNNWYTATYFNKVNFEKDRHSVAVDDRLGSEMSVRRWNQVEAFVQSSILSLGLMGACLIAAYQVSKDIKPVGSFVMLLGYWAQLSGPLQFFSSGFTSITLDLVDAEEFVALLRKVPSVMDRPGAKRLRIQQGAMSFSEVTFSYDKRRQALKGITFEAQPGQTIALVGETGSGKSTILKLLFRLYDPDYGSVEIDGQDLSDVSLQSLRDSIGVVPQDPALFNDTIFNNLKYAKETATVEEIHNACAAVRLHERFLSFPDGYETKVGERGVKLSGGELQRVAIARVIIKNPKFVLLDEATSAVDSETEAHIQHSLAQLTAGRTTLVIAHRLSTIIKADQILVLKEGNIVERGDHRSLVKHNGYYCRLWKQQVGLDSKTDKTTLKPDAPEFVPTKMAR